MARELEIRSRSPAWLGGNLYAGAWLPLWLFAVPALALAPFGALGVPLYVYTVYLYYASIRLCAGSMWDLTSLRLAGARALPVFMGKWLGSLVPLGVELFLVGAVLACVPVRDPLSWERWAWLVGFLGMGALWGGLWGTFCAATTGSPSEGARRGTLVGHVLMFIVPALSVATAVNVNGHGPLASAARMGQCPAFVSLAILHLEDSSLVLALIASMTGLAVLVAPLLCVVGVRSLHRRLQ